MKPNAISGIQCHVADLEASAAFYETLGFRRGKEEADRVTFYVNWFFVTLIAHDGPAASPDEGVFLCVKVDEVDAFHRDVVGAGLEPAGEPERRPSGNREFGLRDPDGHHLVFFQKKK